MTYVRVDSKTGKILSACNKNIYGDEGFDVGCDADPSELVDCRYLKDGILSVRPDLSVPDSVSFSGDVTFDLGDGGKVLAFDREFLDLGDGVTVDAPVNLHNFQVTLVPPFPYKTKVVTVTVEPAAREEIRARYPYPE